MNSNSPHIIIVGLLFAAAHYTQLGTELVIRMLPEGMFPRLSAVTDIAMAIALWMLVIFLIPKACRLILAAYAFVGRVYDRAYAWSKHKLIEGVKRLLEWLTQNGPRL